MAHLVREATRATPKQTLECARMSAMGGNPPYPICLACDAHALKAVIHWLATTPAIAPISAVPLAG